MPEMKLYEYAVIRYVPKVEREEFINIGVILYSKMGRYLDVKFIDTDEKICRFDQDCDIATLRSYLQSFRWICEGNPLGGPMAMEGQAERFRWLTATRSTILQTGKIHPGFTSDPAATLEELFTKYVL